MDMNANIRQLILATKESGGKTTVSQARSVVGCGTTTARYVLSEALELGFLTVKKSFHEESVFEVTDKPLSDLVDERKPLVARFEELLAAWNIPMLAPEGWRGRIHLAFS
jgi:hypothetical protein